MERAGLYNLIALKKRGRRSLAFLLIVVAGFLLDRITKILAGNLLASQGSLYDFGLVSARLVYNTGAAWGTFSESTIVLGLFSILVSGILGSWYLFFCKSSSWLCLLGFSLVVSGGLGNAWDRLVCGRVIDFISLNFIDFPVFNVADIGVTIGFTCIFLWLMTSTRTK